MNTMLRQLERIEEGFLRELLKTPIAQLYLEVGQIPARFEIIKIRLLFLKSILNQSEDSLVLKFFHAQSKTSAKGEGVSMCIENLQYLKITQTFEEIKKISGGKFKNLINESIKREALIYRRNKQGIKGGEIEYSVAIQ